MGARLGLLHDRKKKGDKTDMISGMIMMLLIAVVAVVGFFLYVWLWATKNEPKELKVFELKYVFPPEYCPTCGQNVAERHLQVLATNEEEALMMRRYLLCEGFEA